MPIKAPTKAWRDPRIPLVRLSNGIDMPMLSLGVWQLSNVEVSRIVPMALSIGINHIDASIFYGVPENGDAPNQAALGDVLALVERDSYFVTTKIDPDARDSRLYARLATPFTAETAYFRTLEQAAHNLADLRVAYVDLLLVHWSAPSCDVMRETWRAMEEAHRRGWARAIGVSNYCPRTLQCLLPVATVRPAVNQVKLHVGMGADPGGVRDFCGAHGVVVQAYSPLGAGGKSHSTELIDGQLVTAIARAAGARRANSSGHAVARGHADARGHDDARGQPVSGAQVALRWLSARGVPFSTKSHSESHLREAIGSFELELSSDELAALDGHASEPAESYSFTCECEHTDTCSPWPPNAPIDDYMAAAPMAWRHTTT